MLTTLLLLPIAAGLALWCWRPRSRLALGLAATAALAATSALALWAAWSQPTLVVRWGAGLDLHLEVAPVARAPMVLVPAVAVPIVAYAAAHEHRAGLARMVGLLVAFVGAMQIVLTAGDLLVLLIGWELVGALSWALISHEWRTSAPSGAAGAFTTTRFGDLGLFLAAGAAFAGTGTLAFDAVAELDGGPAAVLVAGVLLAALSKSAQVPFAPWLFSAMAGPTPASALLHSATMVAAGAYLLARLHPVLDAVWWFAPTAVGVGLLTALAAGVVAIVQPDAKKLLAASTSAQYGLMIVAVGAGFPTVAIAHLVAHGVLKALLFLSAGVAITASGHHDLARMGLGRELRAMTWSTACGAAALAAVPPLGAAWTKEEIVAAAGDLAPWLGVLVITAGGMSAFYAARFQLLAYGSPRDRAHPADRPSAGQRVHARAGVVERVAAGALAVASIALGVLWVPAVHERLAATAGGMLPTGAAWEVAGSWATVALAIYAAAVLARRHRLAHLAAGPGSRWLADWYGLPAMIDATVVRPTLRFARLAGRFDDAVVDGAVRGIGRVGRRAAASLGSGDDRVVDAGVRGIAALGRWSARLLDRVAEVGVDGVVAGLAGLVGAAGRDSRRVQTGQTHTYYALIAVGTVVLVALTAIWSL